VATPKLKSVTTVEAMDKLIQEVPNRRLATPDEIAAMIAWLASDESSYANGADFAVNGGLHMS
jgi:acetoacetyl-CoA reductase